jgi:hypothetical protein
MEDVFITSRKKIKSQVYAQNKKETWIHSRCTKKLELKYYKRHYKPREKNQPKPGENIVNIDN